MDDTAKLIGVIVLASFAMERVLAAVTYMLEAMRMRRLKHPVARKIRRREWRRVLLMLVGGAVAYAVVRLVDVRVLRTLGTHAHAAADFWLTWLILLAGADRARELLKEAKGQTAVRIHVDRDVARVS
jgi:hypothetical protein